MNLCEVVVGQDAVWYYTVRTGWNEMVAIRVRVLKVGPCRVQVQVVEHPDVVRWVEPRSLKLG